MSNQQRILVCVFLLLFNNSFAQPRQGMPAEEIALKSINGDTLNLSSLRGKVVLIDFWASWCMPCRASNKAYRKVYSKFRDKGFEIFAVSLDDTDEAWKAAVVKDKIEWPQVIDHGGWEANTAQRWQVSALPTNYLMDKEGRLIGMDLTKKQLENALKLLLDK